MLVDAFDGEPILGVGLIFLQDERLVAWRRRYFEDDAAADGVLEWNDVAQLGRRCCGATTPKRSSPRGGRAIIRAQSNA